MEKQQIVLSNWTVVGHLSLPDTQEVVTIEKCVFSLPCGKTATWWKPWTWKCAGRYGEPDRDGVSVGGSPAREPLVHFRAKEA